MCMYECVIMYECFRESLFMAFKLVLNVNLTISLL